jgi:hypothetical protein
MVESDYYGAMYTYISNIDCEFSWHILIPPSKYFAGNLKLAIIASYYIISIIYP